MRIWFTVFLKVSCSLYTHVAYICVNTVKLIKTCLNETSGTKFHVGKHLSDVCKHSEWPERDDTISAHCFMWQTTELPLVFSRLKVSFHPVEYSVCLMILMVPTTHSSEDVVYITCVCFKWLLLNVVFIHLHFRTFH